MLHLTTSASPPPSPLLPSPQWLVFGFESDSTLGNALDGELGPFPESLAKIVLRKEVADPEKRDYLTVKEILRQIMLGVQDLHSIGLVHRGKIFDIVYRHVHDNLDDLCTS